MTILQPGSGIGKDLKRQLVGLSIGSAAVSVKAFQAAVFVAIEDLVAGDAGNAELTAYGRHFLTFE